MRPLPLPDGKAAQTDLGAAIRKLRQCQADIGSIPKQDY